MDVVKGSVVERQPTEDVPGDEGEVRRLSRGKTLSRDRGLTPTLPAKVLGDALNGRRADEIHPHDRRRRKLSGDFERPTARAHANIEDHMWLADRRQDIRFQRQADEMVLEV